MIREQKSTTHHESAVAYIHRIVPMRLCRIGHPLVVIAFVLLFASVSYRALVIFRTHPTRVIDSLAIAPVVRDYTTVPNPPSLAFNSARFNVWVSIAETADDATANVTLSPLAIDSLSWDGMKPYVEGVGGEWWVVQRLAMVQGRGLPLVFHASEESTWNVLRLSPKRIEEQGRIKQSVIDFVVDYNSAPERQKFVWHQQRDALRSGEGSEWTIGGEELLIDLLWWLSLGGMLVSGVTFFAWLGRKMKRRKLLKLLLTDRCLRCKYDLSGTAASASRVQCPECGQVCMMAWTF